MTKCYPVVLVCNSATLGRCLGLDADSEEISKLETSDVV